MENQKKTLSDREVTDYTSSLWKYKAVPSENVMPYPVPEYQTDNHTIPAYPPGKFQVIAARVRGKKHKHEGSNCDDWFETENTEGIFISAVSDGAGSKKFSRIGAKAACRRAKYFLDAHLKNLLKKSPNLREDLSKEMSERSFTEAAGLLASLVQDAMLSAREAVEKAYEDRRFDEKYTTVVGRTLQLKDFACTLLLTIAVPLEKLNETLIISCQVGDGITAAINTQKNFDEAVTLLGIPDSGKFSGETDFLTSSKFALKENLISRTKLSRKPIDLIFSMTDGVADDYDPNEIHMQRLYFDLLANRILPFPKNLKPSSEVAPILKVPDPRSYPKLDDREKHELFPIQYTSELCTECNLSLKQIWENRETLLAMAQKIPFNRDLNPATRLKEWLDNYTIRGSFDDRTLVILRKDGDDYGEQDD